MIIGILSGIFISVLAIASQAVVLIPQGYAFTIERFGRFTMTLSPGLHIIIPFIDRVGARVNLMERVLEIPAQDVISRDNAMVRVDGVCFFKVVEPSYASYKILDLEKGTTNIIMTNIRTALGAMDLDQMLSHRDEINEKLLQIILDATEEWGIKVTRIEIKDIHPPKDLILAMGAQMKAERERRARILEAEGFKQAEILKAEGLKQSRVLSAEAEKAVVFLEAEARERYAKAEQFAAENLSIAIKNGSPEALQYYLGQDYIKAFHSLASSPQAKTVFIPYDNASMIGSIGAIKELFETNK
jgi:regulator of protease activity HflC (stomatin/prohibitin superfamily)